MGVVDVDVRVSSHLKEELTWAIDKRLRVHIKTHLWDLSTNLSKLNIFLKLKNIVLYES